MARRDDSMYQVSEFRDAESLAKNMFVYFDNIIRHMGDKPYSETILAFLYVTYTHHKARMKLIVRSD